MDTVALLILILEVAASPIVREEGFIPVQDGGRSMEDPGRPVLQLLHQIVQKIMVF